MFVCVCVCANAVDVPFIQAAKPLLQARVPVLLFGGGHQRVYHDKPLEEESLDLLMKANVLGGLRGPITQGTYIHTVTHTHAHVRACVRSPACLSKCDLTGQLSKVWVREGRVCVCVCVQSSS